MKTKALKNINAFFLVYLSLFALSYKDWVFYIQGNGVSNENKITFGLTDYFDLGHASYYEIDILIFCSIYLVFLFISFLIFAFYKQNHWANLSYLFFIVSIGVTFALLVFNHEESNVFIVERSPTLRRIIGRLENPQYIIDMDTITFATFFYSIPLSFLSFISILINVFFKGKIKQSTIEDHLID